MSNLSNFGYWDPINRIKDFFTMPSTGAGRRLRDAMLLEVFQARVILPQMRIWFGHKKGEAAPERGTHFAKVESFSRLGE